MSDSAQQNYDDIAADNRQRWNTLVDTNVQYARPWLDLDPAKARELLDPHRITDDVAGKKVLLLAGGGGQQSAAFAMLGAQVTVLELSDKQLERDQMALAHYGYTAELHQGDMRDLSRFEAASFDMVWHPYSINFVPDVSVVFAQVARVLRPRGMYRTAWGNPFTKNTDERDWNGQGYTLKYLYQDGEMQAEDMTWDVEGEDGSITLVEGPHEFNHTLSTFINQLAAHHFAILALWEDTSMADKNAAPGTWAHFTAVAPPWFDVWTRYLPDVLG
ncbi:MAG: hypothetical protein OHK0046_19390 [Anaerolineae bacterium]